MSFSDTPEDRPDSWAVAEARSAPIDCRVCGGEGWLPTDDAVANRQRPVGDASCPYCGGSGRETASQGPLRPTTS